MSRLPADYNHRSHLYRPQINHEDGRSEPVRLVCKSGLGSTLVTVIWLVRLGVAIAARAVSRSADFMIISRSANFEEAARGEMVVWYRRVSSRTSVPNTGQ